MKPATDLAAPQKPKNKLLQETSTFSKVQVAVFGVVFALVGGYFLYHSFAAAPLIATLEGEQMSQPAGSKIVTDTTASAGKALELTSAAGTSTTSAAAVTAAPTAKPAIPTGLAATAGNGTVTLTWNANAASDQVNVYQVYYGTNANFTNFNGYVPSVTGTTYTVSGLTNGTTYYFRVSAHNSVGYGPWSATPVSAAPKAGTTTGPGNPSAPGILDTFARNDTASPPSASWTNKIRPGDSTMSDTTGQAVKANGNEGSMWWNKSAFGPNSEAYVTTKTLAGAGNGTYLYVRASNVGTANLDGYSVWTVTNGNTYLYRITNNVRTQIGYWNITPAPAAGESYLLAANANQISVAYEAPGATSWTTLGTVTDSTYSGAGYIGTGTDYSLGRLVNFGGGTLGATTTPTPTNPVTTGTVNFPSSVTSLTVMAKGDQCNGAPQMNVTIDGSTVISAASVSNTSWSGYAANVTLGSGAHSLTITLANSYSSSSCARNLYIDVTDFYGPVATTPAPTATLSASSSSVTAGSSVTLTWNSANATSCAASGAWSGSSVGTSGSKSTGALNQTSTYTLTCTGSNNQTASQSTTVTVTQPTTGGGGSGGGGTSYTPTYYVSPSGSDSNSGTSSSSPWKTISKVASTCLSPGNVVAFQGGATFNDTYLDVSCSGTAASPIVFTSYGTGQAILSGGVWFNGGHHDVKLDNLNLTDSAGSIIASCGSCTSNPAYDITIQNSNIHDTPGVGIEPNYGSNWLIANNTITNTGDSGIIDYYTANSTITKNTISNTGGNTSITYGKHGIYSKGTGTTIISYNNFSNNLNGQSVSIRTHGQYIYGNTIHDTGYAFAFFDYDTAAPPQGTTYIYNNLLYNISGYAFYDSNQADPQGNSPTVSFVIANNTFVNNSSGSEMFNLSETPSGMSITTVNNIFSGSFGSAYRSCATCSEHNNLWYGGSSNAAGGSGDVFANPLLNSAPILSLQSGSPAINKGTTSVPGLSYSLNTDGAPLHYQGSAPDLGAVESPY